ncbi:MAG: serine/threonine protein kinase [Lentisphaeraceae bacterium]|nr:serine/threonine protein kinase [Lentisphaeraceae bacterium]
MNIDFQCKNCSEFMSLDSQQKGHDVTCGACGTEQRLPLQGSIEVGNIIEDHLIQQEIGQGAMGKVYLASHLLMNRQVAIKTISPKIRQDDDAVEQFIQELQMGAQLTHPNIVTVYTAGYTDGVYFISMQYIDGFDMNERVESSGALPEKEALAVVSTVADAMSYAWNDFRMIHRDIKPENVRISSRGDIMIMDFGLAKMRSNEAEMNEEGLVIGTPDFMSPEQAEGRSDIDFRADMYSLGVVLIYLLTSKRPFQAPDPLDVVAMHINRPMPSLKELNESITVSKDTVDLIRKMTNKDRDERFISWEEVSEAVDRILASDKSKAGPRKKKSPGRAGGNSSRSVRSRSVSPAKVRRRRRQSSGLGALILVIVVLGVILGVIFASGR